MVKRKRHGGKNRAGENKRAECEKDQEKQGETGQRQRHTERDKRQTHSPGFQRLTVMPQQIRGHTHFLCLTHTVFKGALHAWLHSAILRLCPPTPLHSHHCCTDCSFTLKTSLAVLGLVILHTINYRCV